MGDGILGRGNLPVERCEHTWDRAGQGSNVVGSHSKDRHWDYWGGSSPGNLLAPGCEASHILGKGNGEPRKRLELEGCAHTDAWLQQMRKAGRPRNRGRAPCAGVACQVASPR